MTVGARDQVIANTQDGWQVVGACPICSAGETFLHLFEQVDHQGDLTLTYWICAQCGVVFQSPRMSSEALAAYYAGEYRRQVQGQEGPTRKDLYVQIERAKNLTRILMKHVEHISIHLDVGASAGTFLAQTSTRYGCRAIGVEPGVAYRQYAEDQGIEMYPALEDLPEEVRGRADLVSLIHVLEHLSDPVSYLRTLREVWMSDDGWLLLEVPNLFGHMSLELSHVLAFSLESLQRALWLAGFRVEAVLVHGNPRSRFLKLYITVLARPHAQRQDLAWTEINVRKARRNRWFANQLRRWSTRLVPWLAWRPLPAEASVSEFAKIERPKPPDGLRAGSSDDLTQDQEPCS